MRILVVEDELDVARWVCRTLAEDGEADVAATVADALARARSADYDLVVVDLGLPGGDGLALVTALREGGARTPILILTGRREDDETVARWLDAGADDYVTKPVSATLLRARARAVVRRARGGALRGPPSRDALPAEAPSGDVTLGDLTLGRATRCVRGPRGVADLTAKEYALLDYLVSRPGEVVSRDRLLRHAWDYDFDPGTNVVEVALSRVRQKLVHTGSRARLRTLRGMGVRLEAAAPDDPAA